MFYGRVRDGPRKKAKTSYFYPLHDRNVDGL